MNPNLDQKKMKRAKGERNVNVTIYNMFARSIWKNVCLGNKSRLGNFKICGDSGIDAVDPDLYGDRWIASTGTSDINYYRTCSDV